MFSPWPDDAITFDMVVTIRNSYLTVEKDTFSPDKRIEPIKNEFTRYRTVGSDWNGGDLFIGWRGN